MSSSYLIAPGTSYDCPLCCMSLTSLTMSVLRLATACAMPCAVSSSLSSATTCNEELCHHSHGLCTQHQYSLAHAMATMHTQNPNHVPVLPLQIRTSAQYCAKVESTHLADKTELQRSICFDRCSSQAHPLGSLQAYHARQQLRHTTACSRTAVVSGGAVSFTQGRCHDSVKIVNAHHKQDCVHDCRTRI